MEILRITSMPLNPQIIPRKHDADRTGWKPHAAGSEKMEPEKAKKNSSIALKMLVAGLAACLSDLVTFPLDTTKVRLQVQGEGSGTAGSSKSALKYSGVYGTMKMISKEEGVRGLYNGLNAGLQRQLCFASVRFGLYEPVKEFYQKLMYGSKKPEGMQIPIRIAAGVSTGALSVVFAQPTDVVKIRFQAQEKGAPVRYKSTFSAYKTIAETEGLKGLWKGTTPNIGRNAIVNVSEIVCYDIIKDMLIASRLMSDNITCHFTSGLIAGFFTTLVASPVDVIKTRYMNSKVGQYKGVIDCAVKSVREEGPSSLYKGFTPSFYRLVVWNIVMWISFEQLKILFRV